MYSLKHKKLLQHGFQPAPSVYTNVLASICSASAPGIYAFFFVGFLMTMASKSSRSLSSASISWMMGLR